MRSKKLFQVLLPMLVIGAMACQKDPKPSPTKIEDAQKTISLFIDSVPEGTVGKNGAVFIVKDDRQYASQVFVAAHELELQVLGPDIPSFNIIAHISDDPEWAPHDGIDRDKGWTSQISNVVENDLDLLVNTWATGGFTGSIAERVRCNFQSPVGNSSYEKGDIINVSVTASDLKGGYIQGVEVFLDGDLLQSMEDAPDYLDINTNEVEQGKHVLRATATNGQGIKGQATTSFTINPASSSAPEVSFDNLLNGATVERGTYQTVRINAFDDTELQDVSLAINNQVQANFQERPFIYRWKTENYPVGITALRAEATDEDGNTRSKLINVEITPTDRPIVSFLAPDYNEEITQGTNYGVRIRIEDPDGIANTSFRIDGSALTLQNSGGTEYTYDWETTNVSVGRHSLTVSATDNQGETRSRTISVTIIN